MEKQIARRLKPKERDTAKHNAALLASALIVLATFAIFMSSGSLTGFVAIEAVTGYEDELNVSTSESITYIWQPENAGELRSVAVSGRIKGEGTAKVYLEKEGARYLILDSSLLEEKGLASITGFTISESDAAQNGESNADNTAEITSTADSAAIAQNESENATLPNDTEVNITEPVKNIEAEKAINISLQYNSGTLFDADNDGTEFNNSAIDFTVANTNFSWDAGKLCTQWIIRPDESDAATALCFGERDCCALLDVAPESSSWDDMLAISPGLYGTEANNTVSSRVISANYSLSGEIYSEIIYSDFSSLSAVFIPEQEKSAEKGIEFINICKETCALAGLNESSYKIVIEVENAAIEISRVSYTIAAAEEIDSRLPIVTIISPRIRIYNTTTLELNFTTDEPASRIWYELNNGSSVTVNANTTITAAEGNNTLKLFAKDLAGNTGTDEVMFKVRLADATNATAINITPKLKALKKDYRQGEDAKFEFEYMSEEEFTKRGSAEKPAKPKKLSKWATENETITAEIFDSRGNKAAAEVEIAELREGKFELRLAKQRAFRAGKYTLQLQLTKDNITYTEEQNFTWGVLAINTNKSIFLPNEAAFIAMAVLDDQGHMVCDANVTLKITAPDNAETILTTKEGSIKVSDECEVYGVTNLPDYYTTYSASGIGTYEMNLTAATSNGERSILDSFSVQSTVEFDVARNGPTRIFPQANYTMNITITANENHNGKITEYVPATFNITQQQGLTATTAADAKVLSWNVQLKKGDTISLAYEFDAPDASPEFYILGELEIGTWKEARQWQIASDAPAKILDDSFSCDKTSIEVGETTLCTGQYDNSGDSFAVTCTLQINNEATIALSNSCGANNLRVSAIDVSGASAASCSDTGSGTVDCVNWPSTADNQVIVWTMEGCAESTANTLDTFTGCTNTLNNVALDIAVTDTTPPNNSIVLPEANSNFSVAFTVNASVNDSASDVNDVSFSLLQPEIIAEGPTAMSLIDGTVRSGYRGATYTIAVSDGIYNLSVKATDSAATPNTNISANVSITIDKTPANVTIDKPTSGTTFADESFLINASVNDPTSKVLNATFRIYNSTHAATDWLDATLGAGDKQTGWWNATVDSATLTNDQYNITINATDYAGNQNIKNITTITINNAVPDTTQPNVSIVIPEASTNISGSFIVNASVNDSESDVNNVNLSLLQPGSVASGPIAMNLSVGSATSGYRHVIVDSTTAADGYYNLSVNATDSAATPNTNISANVSIMIDNTDANLTLLSPINLTNFTDQNIVINASANDTTSKVLNVSFRIYNSTHAATDWLDAAIDSGNYDQGYWRATVSSTTLVNGYYNITVNATDFAGNQLVENLSSINVSNAVTTAPIVYNVTSAQITPTAASHATNVVVRFNVTDADGADDADSGLDDTTAKVNITFLPGETAEYSRFNNTGNCATIATFNGDQDRTYECKVAIRYHDNASALWRINASVEDKSNSASYNSSQNLTINSLSAIDLVNANLAASGSIGNQNLELTLVINNTGNFEFTYMNLTPRLLNASLTDFFMLGGETSGTRGSANFSFQHQPAAASE
ncbi:hypothetical protein HYX10_04045 [Candidatus Woesearchaeota archaeon]|nr:hypothetical protein [Candidatus Woesearchaeota archaeon]